MRVETLCRGTGSSRVLLAAFLAISACATPLLAKSSVITRPVTILVGAAAGGGTDVVSRALAQGLREYLGVQITVQNMLGAGGGTAAEYVWKKKPRDGTVIWGLSETCLFLPGNGGHYTTTKDWEYFWAGGTPGAVIVKNSSKYKTFKDLIDDAKQRPGEIRVAASVQPGLWCTRWMATAQAAGIKTNVLGYTGSNPSLLAALSGEVDVVHVSVGEALPYLQAKQLRALTMIELEPFTIPGVGTIPAVVDILPEMKKVLPMPQLLGIAVPADTPEPVMNELRAAFLHAMKSKAVRTVMKTQLATPLGLYGDEAKKVSKKLESQFNWMLVDLGMAVKNPADLGIEKPGE